MTRGYITPVVVTPPAQYPVSLAEVRAQLGIETTDEDARLTGLIAAATEMAEQYTNRSFISRSYRGFLDCFPYCGHLELPRAPLQSVTSITTFDDDGDVATVFSADDYYVDTGSTLGRVALRSGSSWPTFTRRSNGAELIWVAGFGDNPADVPEGIRLAIQVLIGWLNEQRGDEASPKDMPMAAEALLNPYRIFAI
jgi:uncharacterized phiE125 gp8 family phage protein